jgi:hypothetical protein
VIDACLGKPNRPAQTIKNAGAFSAAAIKIAAANLFTARIFVFTARSTTSK